MRIAFYKARHGTLLDKLIDRLTESVGFSHVELVFDDGTFFSSSGRDGGVRLKTIVPKPDHWKLFDLPILAVDERKLRLWCGSQVGRKYDWWGVLRFVLPIRPHHDRWFCSEIVTTCLQGCGLLPGIEPWQTSPNDLFKMIRALLISQSKCNSPGWLAPAHIRRP